MKYVFFVFSFLPTLPGIVLLFGPPGSDWMRRLSALCLPEPTLRDRVTRLRFGSHSHPARRLLQSIQNALEEAGYGARFPYWLGLSLLLGLLGLFLALLCHNPYLIPALSLSFATLPLLYLTSLIHLYKNSIEEDLESTLSTITASLLRTRDILSAVEENLPHIRGPLQAIFSAFLFECRNVSPSLADAIAHMEEQVDHPVFSEWCRMLTASLEDSHLTEALPGIVERLSDARIVNGEVRETLRGARVEFILMSLLTLSNIPLLYLINRDWYEALVHTGPGQLVLGITGMVLYVFALLTYRWTRPVTGIPHS